MNQADGLTEHDRGLIARAEDLLPVDWDVTIALEAEAETAQAREIIHDIGSRLYHRDEYNHGML